MRKIWHRLLPTFILALATGITFAVYLDISLHDVGLVLPLDDTYIHFQYTRQVAQGTPFVYNPGEAVTSGATSLLYPFLLAPGYALGFQGLSLGLWAVWIGTTARFLSSLIVYRFARRLRLPIWAAWLAALLFSLNGAFTWHSMSGMETAVVVLLTLATLYAALYSSPRLLAILATLLALSRPEGSIMVIILIVTQLAWRWIGPRSPALDGSTRDQGSLAWSLLPALGVLLQPALNLLLTGSLSASGSQAKSILGTVPFDWHDVISRIAQNARRMVSELLTGTDGTYVPLAIAGLATLGWLSLLFRRQLRPALLIALWFAAVVAAVATLDTAFWHFKRYQIPLMALQYPLALFGIAWLWQITQGAAGSIPPYRLMPRLLVLVFIGSSTVQTWQAGGTFLHRYRVNVHNVMAQPLPMALWLQENTDSSAIIAVHDVGMMRYIGQRTTIDLVGLTTPDAVDFWRNGPGAVAEFLLHHDPPPDYVAAYTTARGLNYLVDTQIYGTELVGFQALYNPADNVALGADYQGIFRYEAVGSAGAQARGIHDTLIASRLDHVVLADSVNVADVQDEASHDYAWHSVNGAAAFATEVYQFNYATCHSPSDNAVCQVIDGGRRIDGWETFTLATQPGQPAILVTRMQSRQSGTLEIEVDGVPLATRWLPALPGQWYEMVTWIPASAITGEQTRIRVTPEGTLTYMPYFHWLWQGEPVPSPPIDGLATYQDGAFTLGATLQQAGPTLSLDLHYATHGTASGDYKLFVHVYADEDAPPVAQYDGYPALHGVISPPGGWIPGVFSQQVMVDLSQLAPGEYSVAIGFYSPTDFARLMPTSLAESVRVDAAGQRLFVAEIVIPDDA